jgi:hypothetical protein
MTIPRRVAVLPHPSPLTLLTDLQEWGEEKRALGGRGIFMARGTHSTIIEKTAPENIRVVVGSIQFKLIQFRPNLHLYLHINLSESENCILLCMEGGSSEEGGKTVQRNVNGLEEIIVVQKVLLPRHQYIVPSRLPFPLICLCWNCNSSIVLPQPCSLAILSMMLRPWANLIPNIVVSVASKINDASDSIMFKAICKGWNCACSGEACQFDPWILKSEFIDESGAVTFAFVADTQFLRSPFLHWLGKGPD